MKTLNFFRKPYLAYLVGFMLLFVSCKQYELDDNNEVALFKYSAKDVDNMKNSLKTLKLMIDREANRNYVDPFEITALWYQQNYNDNIIPISEQNKNYFLDYLDFNKSNEYDIFDFIEQNNLYTQQELNLLYQLRDNILSGVMTFENAINQFESDVVNSNLSTDRKNVLLVNSFILNSINQAFPSGFTFNQNRSVGCAVSAIGLGFAFAGLIVASGGTALGAAIAGGGYVASLISTGLSCFSQ